VPDSQSGSFLPQFFRQRRAYWMGLAPLGQASSQGQDVIG
jgi:hypothetical protein